MGRGLFIARLQNDPCYTSCLIFIWEWALGFRVQFPSARHVLLPRIIFWHAMNPLIFSDNSENYSLNSVDESHGIALEIMG